MPLAPNESPHLQEWGVWMVWLNLTLIIEPLSSSGGCPSQGIRLDQGLWFPPRCVHPLTLHIREPCPCPPEHVPFFILCSWSKRPPEVDSQVRLETLSSQSHNPPTNFLELCKALETFCRPISESPLPFSRWCRCLGGTEEVPVVFFPEGDCCWVPCIRTEHTVQPAQC